MNDFEFAFEESAWDLTLGRLQEGDKLSAVRFLTLLEEESDSALEDALLDLEMKRVTLDISDLPKTAGSGEAALRLRREAQLVKEGTLLQALDENDPLRLYLEELAAIPACGDPQILAMECAEAKESSREKLLNTQLYRVVETAKELTGNGVLLLDLIQEGSLGLWQAIASFEGGNFEEIAQWHIHQAMAKIIVLQARANGVGQKMKQALEDYRAVDERLLAELGRNATLEEIALEMHITPDEAASVKETLDSARMLNRARPDEDPEEKTEDEERHVEDTALFQMRQRIMELLSNVSEEDSGILTLRFGLEGGLPLSPEETGRKLGLTPEEVVAREAAALAQLRNGK